MMRKLAIALGVAALTLGGTAVAGAQVQQGTTAGDVRQAGEIGTLGVSDCMDFLVANGYTVTISRGFACTEAAAIGTVLAATACAGIMINTGVDAATATNACMWAIVP